MGLYRSFSQSWNLVARTGISVTNRRRQDEVRGHINLSGGQSVDATFVCSGVLGLCCKPPIILPSSQYGERTLLLNVYIDESHHPIETPPGMVVEAEDFFAKMDADMDQGWQMSRQWVDKLSPLNRCQIVADKLMTALDAGNETLVQLMAAYILKRMPGVAGVRINTDGEMLETRLIMESGDGAEQ